MNLAQPSNLPKALPLEQAQELAKGLTDRQLIALNIRLNEKLGGHGYGADYARHSKQQKLRLALVRLSEVRTIRDGANYVDGDLFTQPFELTPPGARAETAIIVDDAIPKPLPQVETKAQAQAPSTAPDEFDKLLALRNALSALTGSAAVDEATVRAIVKSELDKQAPARVELHYPNLPPVDATGKHPLFPLVLALVNLPAELRPNVLLVGPAGCGKTTLAHHVAQALERSFGATSLSAGVSESSLTGWLLPVKANGAFGYVPAGFVQDYATGAVHLLDELDAADPNVLCVVNAALANGHIYVQQRIAEGEHPAIAKHEDTVILCAANTFGTGADDLYQGRNALDAATLDRFLVLEMEYDEARELASMGVDAKPAKPWGPTASTGESEVRSDLKALANWIIKLREGVKKAGIRRVISSRMFDRAKALRMVGCSVGECKDYLLTGWTADELKACAA